MASVDDVATNTAFAEKNDANFPVLSDPSKEVAAAYGVLMEAGYATRWTYYIDPQGKIAHIDKRVTPLSAGADMLARLEQLGVARTAN